MKTTGISLEGRVAIVTGGGGKIGEASARALALAGARVVVADIDLHSAERVAAAIGQAGGNALAHPVELVEEDSIVALHRAALDHYGQIDILHNNAADVSRHQMAADAMVTAMDPRVWDRAFEVNTRGAMLMIKHSAQAMIKAGGGAIINTSSGVSLLGDIFNPAYASSKGAINSLTRNVAAQLGRNNIRCNAILPGLVLTEHSRAMLGDEQLAMLQRHTLMPRFGVADDIASLVLFLASDHASFITGQLISVDGGLQAHQPWYGDVARPVDD
ncbi:MAG: SDR family oxidoreductase [Porticoccaceae bacterium]|jgi:NAD(P)-dependent dehydrogenase (short-subunit alcohol dehydrogenase family)